MADPSAPDNRITEIADVLALNTALVRQIVEILERIVETLERADERNSYDSALARWRQGQGKHPDD